MKGDAIESEGLTAILLEIKRAEEEAEEARGDMQKWQKRIELAKQGRPELVKPAWSKFQEARLKLEALETALLQLRARRATVASQERMRAAMPDMTPTLEAEALVEQLKGGPLDPERARVERELRGLELDERVRDLKKQSGMEGEEPGTAIVEAPEVVEAEIPEEPGEVVVEAEIPEEPGEEVVEAEIPEEGLSAEALEGLSAEALEGLRGAEEAREKAYHVLSAAAGRSTVALAREAFMALAGKNLWHRLVLEKYGKPGRAGRASDEPLWEGEPPGGVEGWEEVLGSLEGRPFELSMMKVALGLEREALRLCDAALSGREGDALGGLLDAEARELDRLEGGVEEAWEALWRDRATLNIAT